MIPFKELRDCYNNGRLKLDMSASINGKVVSRGNASSMYWTWPQLLAHASRDTRLMPGDVIGSGTVGSGCILELTPAATGGWLKPNDVVQLEIERIGVLENRIASRLP
jgi:fumarylacetoacetate (FAA) hydrolase